MASYIHFLVFLISFIIGILLKLEISIFSKILLCTIFILIIYTAIHIRNSKSIIMPLKVKQLYESIDEGNFKKFKEIIENKFINI